MRTKRFDGPLLVVESDTDPGDMGEPREFWSDEDKADVLIVPSVALWPHGLAAFDGDEPEPVMVEIKDGWAALGNGWAVVAPLERDARGKYREALKLHAEIAARPGPNAPASIEPGRPADVEQKYISGDR